MYWNSIYTYITKHGNLYLSDFFAYNKSVIYQVGRVAFRQSGNEGANVQQIRDESHDKGAKLLRAGLEDQVLVLQGELHLDERELIGSGLAVVQ